MQRKVCGEDGDENVSKAVSADLELLSGLLRSPVLMNILAIQDSIGDLHSHVQNHPSLLATDFDIDIAGRLVLNSNILVTSKAPAEKVYENKAATLLENESNQTKEVSLPASPALSHGKAAAAAAAAAAFEDALTLAAGSREIITVQVLSMAL